MKTNAVYVTADLDDKNLWTKELKLENLHWINEKPDEKKQYQARLRYRGPLVACQLKDKKLILAEEQRGIAAGQSAVIYDGDRVLGGAIIC
jgi:tRNA-specific 2-thiouridylase